MNESLSQFMVRGPCVCDPGMPVAEAFALMRERDVRHLPVVDEEKLVGLLSERDLREALAIPNSQSLRVLDVMKTPVYTVSSQAFLRDVALDMADLKYGSAVVTNGLNEVVGIFTTTDALRALAEILDEPSSKDYLIEDYIDGWITPAQILS